MFNFRTKIKKIEEEDFNKDTTDLYKHVVFLLEGVSHALAEQKYIFGFIGVKKLHFINTGEGIHVKGSANHSTNLFKIGNSNSSKIFKALKAKVKADNFQICYEDENSFTINLD